MILSRTIQTTIALLAMLAGFAVAQKVATSVAAARESLDDAWWTGPMLAPSASTLPRGHFLIEPYLYDVSVQGSYDRNGVRHSTAHASGFGSLTYLLYGVADKFSVGLIPTAGYNKESQGLSSSGVRLGDLTLQGQYRLRLFREGSSMPTISVAVQETLPTAKYDRLGDRPSEGLGSGAYTTTVALFSQTYLWLPNGRILRMRLNVLPAFSSQVNVRDVSVYGTEAGISRACQAR